MIFETVKVKLPSFLASAIINGDHSSLNDSDEKLLEEIYKLYEGGNFVSCEDDSEFATVYISGRQFTGDVCTYVILYNKGERK